MQRLTLTLFVAAVAAASLACVHVHHPRPLPSKARVAKRGPPPHAAAHGYRHKHHAHGRDIELVFDSGVGVYVVVGWPEHYWHDGHYYRHVDGAWQVSVRLGDGWASTSGRRLPPGLAKKALHRKVKKRKGGPYPAKHAR